MTSQTPPCKTLNRGFVQEGEQLFSPATTQNDKASDGLFSPWSVAKASDLTSNPESTPGRGHLPRRAPDTNGPASRTRQAPVGFLARFGGTEQGEHPYLPAWRPIENPYHDQTGSLMQSFQGFEGLFTSPKLQSVHRPDNNDNDKTPSTTHSFRNASIDTIKPDSPINGDLSSTGLDASLSLQKFTAFPSWPAGHVDGGAAAAPIFFQPMSNLIPADIPGKPVGQPDLLALGGRNLHNPPGSVLDRLTANMQQIGENDFGLGLNNTQVGPVARIQRHFSPHYQGDIFLPANQSENIPDDQNCSVFIVNLPPSLTTHQLIAAIHQRGSLGRIFAIHINGPELQRNHPGCAAKVVFFKREVAMKFFTKCELNGFHVNGHQARVMWNRIKTSEKPHLANSDASRVLLIGGPPSIVNSSTLTDFFRSKLEFQIDNIITHVQGSVGNEDTVVEYRFGSFRCQAQAAKMALARELPHIRCFFGRDPLEPEVYRPFEYFSFTANL